MKSHLAINSNTIEFLKNNKNTILNNWLKYPQVLDVLKLHDISFKTFKYEYANNIFDYFIGVIEEKEIIGDCPVMKKYLTFLHNNNVMPHELFLICTHFRQSVFSLFLQNDKLSNDLFNSLSEVFNLNLSGVLFEFKTIIEEKNEELNKRGQRLSEAHQIAKLGHWEYNIVENSLFWSDEIFNIFEIDSTKFSAYYESFLDLIHPEDRFYVDSEYKKSIETKEHYFIEHRLLMNDGRVKYVIERGKTYYDNEINPIKTLGTIQDVTELKDLTEKALQDSLTGLNNRHYLTTFLSKELSHVKRHNLPLAFAICDIDFFKNINDTHGHDIGDLVLKEIATYIKKSVRNEDFICRYGGEEFVIILSGLEIKKVYERMERLRKEISESNINIPINEQINCTISIGITEMTDDCNTFEKLFKSADEALYQAKENGRNSVILN